MVKEEKRRFRPRNGEFCADEYDNIFIASNVYNKDSEFECYGCHVGYYNDNGLWYFNSPHWTRPIRYATEKEIEEFLDRLARDKNMRWNSKDKRVELIE